MRGEKGWVRGEKGGVRGEKGGVRGEKGEGGRVSVIERLVRII